MATVYAKTADGREEIEKRRRGIPPRLRSLLILIDGRQTDEALAKLVPQFEESLAALLAARLVEAVAAAPAAVPDSDFAASEPLLIEGELVNVRSHAADAAGDLLGEAGSDIVVRIENSEDIAQLRAALERAVGVIAAERGQEPAAQFAGRFLATP